MLDPKTKELIAIGASIVAKCQPCLEYHLNEARKSGATDADIRSAVKMAQAVRKTADEIMDEFAQTRVSGEDATPTCNCGENCCG